MKDLIQNTMIILFCLLMTSSNGQDFPNGVCGLNTVCDPYELENENIPISKESELYTYLEDIKKIFNQPFARYNLRNITTQNIAAAHLQRIHADAAARVITINSEHFSSKTNTSLQKKALLIWVLAHEIQHHTNGDLHYGEKIVADNLKKEILADERAGYAVGQLTDIDISFFQQILPTVLYSNEDSNTHPPREYRIMAAQVGWMRAKLEDNDEITIESNIYKVMKYDSGTNVWGQWINDSFNGISLHIYNNGNLYIGESKGGLKDGKGLIMYNDSKDEQFHSIHFGNWKNNLRAGLGTCIWASGKWVGDKYVGSWNGKKRTGSGTYFWADGAKYVGNFINDKMNGEGTYNWKNGETYEGDWVNGMRTGGGTYTYLNGETYEGDWVNGMRTGGGTYTYLNGETYRGQWKDNLKHGDGILYKGDELIKAGCWQEGIYKGVTCD